MDNTFPSWIVALDQQRYRIAWVCISVSSRWRNWLHINYPSLPFVTSIPTSSSILWLFCVGRPPGKTHCCWTLPACVLVVATNTPNRSRGAAPWSLCTYTLAHRKVGGVTDGSFRLYVFTNTNRYTQLKPPSFPQRNVASVVDSLVSGPEHDPPPIVKDLIPYVYRYETNLLSLNGLFPLSTIRHRFLVPSVFASTGWCSRRLTSSELLATFDFPVHFVKTTPAPLAGQIFKASSIPIKCLQALLTAIHKDSVTNTTLGYGGGTFSASLGAQDKCSHGNGGAKNETKEQPVASLVYDSLKATKADNAAVPELIWSERIRCRGKELTSTQRQLLSGFRELGLRRWKRNVCSSFWIWLRGFVSVKRIYHRWIVWNSNLGKYQWTKTGKSSYVQSHQRVSKAAQKNWNAAIECIHRASNASWWEWDQGSRPFFWRWNKDYIGNIRDGIPPWIKSTPEKWVRPQNCDPKTQHLVREKLVTAWKKRNYIEDGYVKNLTRFFAVPKGDQDIRMVYDASASGLNDCLWAPWFLMPTIKTHLRTVNPDYFMADIDIGEMFLNFIMHDSLRSWCGVDFTQYFPEHTKDKVNWKRWARNCMGLKSSPYNCVGVCDG